MTRTTPTRRDVLYRLGSAGAVAIGVGLAGCSGGDGGGDGSGDDGGDGGGDGSGNGSGDGSGDGGGGGTTTADMTDSLNFDPSSLTISSGTTVTWENVGTVGHTVTAYGDQIPSGAAYFASGGFDSEQAARDGYTGGEGVIEGGESYEHTFETTGTYEYFCIPHESSGMTGSITVE